MVNGATSVLNQRRVIEMIRIGGDYKPGGEFAGVLGPETNEFGTQTTASKAAAAALRTTYETANANWLAAYNGNTDFFTRLIWVGGEAQLQRRNAAGTAWEDATGIIVGPAGAGLPHGSTALSELRWDGGAWTPMSAIQTVYAAATRGNDAQTLIDLLLAVANNTGGIGVEAGEILTGDSRQITTYTPGFTARRAADYRMEELWPPGGSHPYFWVLTPTFWKWVQNFTGNGGTEFFDTATQNQAPSVAPDIMSWKLIIDGVPFDVARWLFSLDRPDDTERATLHFRFTYTPPDDAARTVTQIP